MNNPIPERMPLPEFPLENYDNYPREQNNSFAGRLVPPSEIIASEWKALPPPEGFHSYWLPVDIQDLYNNNIYCAPLKEFPDLPPSARNVFSLPQIRPRYPRRVNILPGALAVDETKEECVYFSMARNEFSEILAHCENRARRQALWRRHLRLGWNGGGSRPRLPAVERVLQIRTDQAQVLGRKDFLTWRFEDKMEKSPEEIVAFLHTLFKKNLPAQTAHHEELHACARTLGLGALKPWDLYYVQRRFIEETIPRVAGRFRHYFVMEEFVPKLLAWVGELFSINFTPETEGLAAGQARYWLTDKTTAAPLGCLNLDLLNNGPNQYVGGAYGYTLGQLPRRHAPSQKELPQVTIKMTLTPDATTQKYFLTYNDVFSLVHEFGHALEHIFSPPQQLSHLTHEKDLLETTSSFMENFIEDPELLSRFSAHYQTGAPLPRAKAQEWTNLKKVRAPFTNNYEISKALLDLHINKDLTVPLAQRYHHVVNQTGLDKFNVYNLLLDEELFRDPATNDYPGNFYTYLLGEALGKKLYAPFRGLRPPYPRALVQALRAEVFTQFGRRPFGESLRKFTGKNLSLTDVNTPCRY